MNEMNNKVFRNNALKKMNLAVLLLIVFLVVAYFFMRRGFVNAIITGGLYAMAMTLILPLRYVLTDKNMLETHFVFGKMRRRTIPVDAILEARMEKTNQLIVRYTKKDIPSRLS